MTDLRESSTRGNVRESNQAHRTTILGPPAAASKKVNKIVCHHCKGTGGERWSDPDGSERGEKCWHCQGFGTAFPEPEIDTARGDYFSEEQVRSYGDQIRGELINELGGYRSAFIFMAEMLGISSNSCSPKEALANYLLPMLQKALEDSKRMDWLESGMKHYGDGHTCPREACIGWVGWQQQPEQEFFPGLRQALDEERSEQAMNSAEPLCIFCDDSGTEGGEPCAWCPKQSGQGE